jgi:glycosyltransferase involved in cell wall biosynthesis
MNRAYATVAHTAHEREWLIARGAKPDKIRLIGHGIDHNELRPRREAFRGIHDIKPSDFLIAYVGQQGVHKGINTLLEVLPEMLEACPSAWLAIGGARTPYSAELHRLVAQLPKHAASRVIFADDMTTQQKADLLGDCDVFASPSQAESFGITTLEAWSLEKPVIVGNGPSQREIVEHGVTGFCVGHGNKADLLNALLRLYRSADLRAEMGRQGRQKQLRDFDRTAIENAYAAVLREAAFSRGALKSA